MQSLEVISLNIWHILISLANLLILYFLIKKFLYAPVKKALAQRQSAIEQDYSEAQKARTDALADKAEYEKQLSEAHEEAGRIIKEAASVASYRENEIISEARDRAAGIVREAANEAELLKRKADEDIKSEIVDVSALLTEKLLDREINENDHRNLIDSFIDKIDDIR